MSEEIKIDDQDGRTLHLAKDFHGEWEVLAYTEGRRDMMSVSAGGRKIAQWCRDVIAAIEGARPDVPSALLERMDELAEEMAQIRVQIESME